MLNYRPNGRRRLGRPLKRLLDEAETGLSSLSQYLTNLMHKICFTISFISFLYMFRAHVLIIRRSELHYTASGIITPIGVVKY